METENKFLTKEVKDFLLDVFLTAVGTGLVALITVYIFRVPVFELQLFYISDTTQTVTDPTHANLLVSLENKKHFISFKESEIFYSLFVPEEFLLDKEFGISTSEGFMKKELESSAITISIGEENYYHFRLSNKLVVNPMATTDPLLFKGDFSGSKPTRICATFSTPYGIFPHGISHSGLGYLADIIANSHCKEFPKDIEVVKLSPRYTKPELKNIKFDVLSSKSQTVNIFEPYFRLVRPIY